MFRSATCLALALFIATAAPAAVAARTSLDNQAAEARPCATVPKCLATVADPDASPDHRYWAKIFLDDHPTPEVVAAFADLLASDLGKQREMAWWYAASHARQWKSQLPALLVAVARAPDHAYLVADIGGSAAWGPLERLARDSKTPAPYAEALRRLDAPRAVEVGIEAVEQAGAFVNADAVVQGVFAEFYAFSKAATAEKRLLAIAAREGDLDVRRRALLAIGAMHTPGEVPAQVRGIYATAPPPLRRAIAAIFGTEVATADDVMPLLLDRMAQGDVNAIGELARLGPPARMQSGAIARWIDHGSLEQRLAAIDALYAVDPPALRRRLRQLAVDPDVAVALLAWRLAEGDGSASAAIVVEAAQTHWYPGLIRLIRAGRVEPEPGTSNDARYPPPFAVMCKDTPGMRARGSLWNTNATRNRAWRQTHSEVPATVAVHAPRGWLTGFDGGEFGGQVIYTPFGTDEGEQVARLGAEPLTLFEWRHRFYLLGMAAAEAALAELVPTKDGYRLETLLSLPAKPQDVVARDGRLLVRLDRNGWSDVTDVHAPKWLGCTLR
jgi:hypothetical protein